MENKADFEWDANKDKANQEKHGRSEFSALGIGGKEKKSMKKKIKYTDEPMGDVRVVSDFLPSPEELALKDETIKVTIALSKTSVDFFKNEAQKYNTQYQKMIRRLLDEYATHQV
jgi:predicted DNA binding CopG/RHH family protein